MRAKALLSLAGAFIAVVALVSASGAATTKAQKVTKINVSTRAAVVHYLRSIHVNPKGAVIQRGARNYAGARCPGGRWTCASTRHTVVQIAKRGGQNQFVCRSSKCVVVQLSGVSHGVYIAGRTLASTSAPAKGNSGTCIKTGSGATTGSGQSCTISQSGSGPNTAVVYENTQKVSGLTQSAQYTALITQVVSSGSSGNTACVTQNINLDGSTTNTNGKPTKADLQAHQSVTINQDAVGGGANTAKNAAVLSGSTAICDTNNTLAQSQTLTSTINATGPITQNQDAAFSLCGDGRTGEYANLCLDIEQNQGTAHGVATGTNNASFTQNSTQTAIAHTTKGPVSQTQSTPLCADSGRTDCVFPGGLVGTLNQDSQGRSIASATQNETQCEDAATSGPLTCSTTPDSPSIPNGLTQKQYGPVGVGNVRHNHRGHRRVGFSHGKGLGQSIQTGNAGCTPGNCNSFTVSQQSTQNADANATQVNLGVADCGTTGSCSAGQTTTVNGSPTSDGYTAPVIGNLVINCPTGQTCAGTPPPAPEITDTPDAQTTSTSAAFTWTEAATAGVTLKCSIDGGATFSTCDSPTSTSYNGLSHGPHTFEVKAVDNTGSHNASAADSFAWEIIPYLTFETTGDGAVAGWSGTPGLSPITLTTGSDYPGTYAQFTIHDSNSLLVGSLVEPTFTTDTFSGGAPRYEIDFSDGDYAFGYPAQQGWGTASWDLNCGQISCVPMSNVMWSAIQGAETGQTVTDALIEADFPANATYNITDFMFDGYQLSFFTN